MKFAHLWFAFLCLALLLAACGSDDDDDQVDDDDPVDDDDSLADDDQVDDDDATPTGDDDDDPVDPTADWLRVGFSQVEVTPAESVILGGYGLPAFTRNSCRWSEGTHDPLYAYGFAVEDPQNARPAILIVLDVVGIMAPETARVCDGVATALGLSDVNVVVAATHVHSGPDTVGLWGSLIPIESGRDEAVIDAIIEGAIAAGVAAWEAREPAILSTAVGAEADYHENRIDFEPNGDVDDTLTVVAATDADGELLGTLMNWACHPTIMGQQNKLMTAGWPGAYRRLMVERFGGTHLFIQGAVGDAIEPLNPVNPFPSWNLGLAWGSWEAIEEFATVIADDATELMNGLTPLAPQRLQLNETGEFSMTLDNIMFWAAAVSGLIPRESPLVGDSFSTPIATFAVGGLGFATLPGEYATAYGFALRELMGGSAQVIVGLGMDWLGYTITPAQYDDVLSYYYQIILSPSELAGENMMEAYRALWASSTVE
ncbi:MAG TPA: neutral/alkaline non-lysosomal ceramidase N-terminal domain-containing protein [bacterium]|nr:neutral/alkaline non-lysosomal ceramidase N-terminal domain-containing protein [bacterium]